jgi:hypothetical protein
MPNAMAELQLRWIDALAREGAKRYAPERREPEKPERAERTAIGQPRQ